MEKWSKGVLEMIDIWKLFCMLGGVASTIPFLGHIHESERFFGNILGVYVIWYLVWYAMEKYYFKTPSQEEIDAPDKDGDSQ